MTAYQYCRVDEPVVTKSGGDGYGYGYGFHIRAGTDPSSILRLQRTKTLNGREARSRAHSKKPSRLRRKVSQLAPCGQGEGYSGGEGRLITCATAGGARRPATLNAAGGAAARMQMRPRRKRCGTFSWWRTGHQDEVSAQTQGLATTRQ